MKRYSKIQRWMLVAAAFLITLMVMVSVVAPRLIDVKPIRKAMTGTVSQKIGGDFKFQKIRLSIFPRPNVTITKGSLAVPETFSATWKALTVSLRLFSLITGNVRISRILVDQPQIDVTAGGKDDKTENGAGRDRPAAIQERVVPLIGFLSSIGEDFTFRLKNGRLNIITKNKTAVGFTDIDADIVLPDKNVDINLSAKASFCDKIDIKVGIDPTSMISKGEINLARISPEYLSTKLAPSAPVKLGATRFDLKLDFKSEQFQSIAADVQGTLPQLTIQRKGKQFHVKGNAFKGRFSHDKLKTKVSITELPLVKPRLTLTGSFDKKQATGEMAVEIKGRGVDVPSTREATLVLAGDIPVVRNIFDILRGGNIPEISFSTRGNSAGALQNLKNMTIGGRLLDGRVIVPAVNLNVTDVNATVDVSNKVLTIKAIKGRYGNTQVPDGTLRLGLGGKDLPFHLDVGLNADLGQLPQILKKVVKNRKVLAQLDRAGDVSGRASGRLILGETLAHIKTAVNVSDFNLSARVQPFPDMFQLEGNDFSYGGTALKIGTLKGRIKNSNLSLNATAVNWQKEPRIRIGSGKADIHLNDIYAYLSMLNLWKNPLKDLKTIGGVVNLSQFQIDGPLAEPVNWDFQAAGMLRKVLVTSDKLPAPLSVRSSGFKATPDELTLTNAETGMMDASLKVSAALWGYRKGLQAVECRFEGIVGAEGNRWVLQNIRVPAHLRIRPPLKFSTAHFRWERGGRISLSGDVGLQDELVVSADVLLETGRMDIRKLHIRDKHSNAVFTLGLRDKKEISFGFNGDLQKITADKLLTDNQTLYGWIRGNLRLNYTVDRPLDTRFEGTLSAKDIVLLRRLNIPLRINSLAVEGQKEDFKISADMLFEEDKQLTLKGSVDYSSAGIRFDADLSSSGIVLDDLAKSTSSANEKDKDPPKEKFWEFPVEGLVRLDAAYVTFGKYTWRPMRGTVALKPEEIVITVGDATLCGISTPGSITLTPREVGLEIHPAALNQELTQSGPCLLGKESRAEGKYSLTGLITGRGAQDTLMRSLAGTAEINVTEGRFYAGKAFRLLRQILAYLNITEIYRGKMPEIKKEGFGFNGIRAKAKLRNNTIVIEEGYIDGLTMSIVCNGTYNIADDRVNLTVLVAPLKTVDSIVQKIPLVGEILGGSLISVPVGVTGALKNPEVNILPVAAVGEGLLGIMKRTLQLPVKVINPLIKGGPN